MLTPKECEAVCAAYNETEETNRRDAWERMRLLACISIQPHVKKKLSPKGLLPLPWDKGQNFGNNANNKDTHTNNQKAIRELRKMLIGGAKEKNSDQVEGVLVPGTTQGTQS